MINRVKDWEDMTIDEMLELYKNNKILTNRLEKNKEELIRRGLENTTLRERHKLSGTEEILKKRMALNIKRTKEYLKQGMSQAEIAMELGVGTSHVRKLIDIINVTEERNKELKQAFSR